MTSNPPPKAYRLGMTRGARFRCPACGEGKLYRRYLKVQACPVCGHDNTAYPADDAPPYFTILLVGHLVIAPTLAIPAIWRQPALLVAAVSLPVLTMACLALLPVVKGAVVGLQWALGHHRRL